MMESEMMNLGKVWLSVVTSLCYCYWIRKCVPPGTTRLVCLLPIITLYLFLPLKLSSVHLTGTTGFFFAWLATFKLLLFAFHKGPLSSDPSISLGRFLAVACLPIKIQSTPHSHSNSGSSTITKGVEYATKGLLLSALVKLYDYSPHIHPKLLLAMYCFHIYLALELILALFAALARTTLGLELEPQFNDPLLSTSLQDFWGRRWNLMVPTILRPTVYDPTVNAARKVIGPQWAPLPAVLGTFLVSGLMHELILYYMGRMEPTFRMTCFFLLHGLCLTVEIALKKALNARFHLPRLLSGPFTVAFVAVTSFSLFLPEFIRCRIDVQAFQEYAALAAFAKNLTSAF